MLASFVLALDHNACRKVCNTNSTFCFLNVLAAGAGCAVNVNSEFGRIDDDIADFVGFREDGNRAGRGVYAALRLGFRNTLYAMAAAFKLLFGLSALAYDFHNDCLVAA